MKNRITIFIEKHLTVIVLIFILWVLVSPILFTQFSIVSFSHDGSTGQIGDTIGGITAPAIGLLSAILLYLALTKQIENNNIIVQESNFRTTYNEIVEFKKSLKEYQFLGQTGVHAIKMFPSLVPASLLAGQTDNLYNDIAEYDNLFNGFHRLFYLKNNLETSDKYSDFLKKEIRKVYTDFFQGPCLAVLTDWNVTEADLVHEIRGRMYMLKQNLSIIHTTIGQKYND
jgi:hypothetical protein